MISVLWKSDDALEFLEQLNKTDLKLRYTARASTAFTSTRTSFASKIEPTDIYPPFTPMNCRFFFVEGDPGSPSAFRFMMDRSDCGDAAGKIEEKKKNNFFFFFTITHTPGKQNNGTIDDAVFRSTTWLWGFLWQGALCWCVEVSLPLFGRQ